MTPDAFQAQSDAWISAGAHVALYAGSALLAVAGAVTAAWLKYGPRVKLAWQMVQDCKARLDVHDQKAGIDSYKESAAPAPKETP